MKKQEVVKWFAGVFVLALGLAAYAQPPVDDAAVRDLSIDNLRHPQSNVWSSGQPTREQFAALAELGVKHVINLRPAEEQDWDEAAYVASLGMHYHLIPVAGAAGITAANAEQLAGTLRQLGDAPVLLHCSSGNRVGGLIALQVHAENGGDIEAAIEQGREWGLTRLEPVVRDVLGEKQPTP
jgi:uncharacterized protein (TIGR01244 family)